jgi:hypothetical protein
MRRDRKIELIEQFFSTGGGPVFQCECNKVYYDGAQPEHYDWEEGEYEELENSSAIKCDYGPGTVDFGQGDFCNGCDCWHDKAVAFFDMLNDFNRNICDLYAEVHSLMEAAVELRNTKEKALQRIRPNLEVGAKIILTGRHPSLTTKTGFVLARKDTLTYAITLDNGTQFAEMTIWRDFKPVGASKEHIAKLLS